MAVIDPRRYRATTRFAGPSGKYVEYEQQFADCPAPECGKRVKLTHSKCLGEHINRFGFHCDMTGLRPQVAARIPIDAAGRLVGIDEMKLRCDADE